MLLHAGSKERISKEADLLVGLSPQTDLILNVLGARSVPVEQKLYQNLNLVPGPSRRALRKGLERG